MDPIDPLILEQRRRDLSNAVLLRIEDHEFHPAIRIRSTFRSQVVNHLLIITHRRIDEHQLQCLIRRLVRRGLLIGDRQN